MKLGSTDMGSYFEDDFILCSKYIININLTAFMEFPQLNIYQSLVEKHLRLSYDDFHPLTVDPNPLPHTNIQELLLNIEEINVSRSYEAQRLKEAENTPKIKSNQSSQETLECDMAESRTFKSDRTTRSKKSNRSLIFAPQKFIKNKEIKQGDLPTIRIYYFDLPVSREISFDPTTKISNLISEAIHTYLSDNKLDHQKIKDRHFQNYQLRMLANEEGFKADLSIPPISYERLVADNMFDALVLKIKDKNERKSLRAEPVEFINNSSKKNTSTILLYNELGDELGTLNMANTDSLQKIFEHIETNDLHGMRSYFLTENQSDNDGLPRDFEVRNLESNTIYIKSRKYIDESDWQTRIKPLKSLTLVTKDVQTRIEMPIGLSEASQYQEFTVIKVNSMGFEQQRILGVDQTKIYNYDKSFRQQKRSTSFFGKIFGVNQQTGTKKPYRLIQDIIDLKKTQKGLIIIYKEKSIPYLVPRGEDRDKLFRKINFLVNHCKEEKNTRNWKN